MEWNIDHLTELVIKYVTDQADPSEREIMEEFLGDPVTRARVAEILSREEFLKEKAFWDEAEDLQARSLATNLESIRQYERQRRVIPMQRWWLAAASVVAIGLSIFLVRNYSSRAPAPGGYVANVVDIRPGGQKATLILSSGNEVILDSAREGEIARETGSTIQKRAEGVIDYRKDAVEMPKDAQEEIAYNTLKTPRGGIYEVVLPDHSIAYLNSESSLKYPTVFSSRSPRVVELTGEAYFIVRHDPARLFRVNVAGREVDALGTSFDVNAYGDEPVIKATLLEGVIRASDHKDSVLLRPGEQAQMLQSGMRVVTSVDTDCVIGWKNGDFVFNATPLGEVMRQLGRWYNVTVKYDSSKVSTGGGFTAEIPRNRPASEVLKALEVSGYHFTITGGKQIEAQALKK